VSNKTTASTLTSARICNTFTWRGRYDQQMGGWPCEKKKKKKKKTYKDGFAPREDGDEVWDPAIDLAAVEASSWFCLGSDGA
jgi:hypothetical protein